MQAGGWPDMGSGRYTMAAGYRAWMEINKGQRVYQNYTENIQQMTASMLIAGLFLPIATAVWGTLYLLARIGYVCAYLQAPNKRKIFTPFLLFTQFTMPVFAFTLCIYFYINAPNENAKNVKSGLYTGLWN